MTSIGSFRFVSLRPLLVASVRRGVSWSACGRFTARVFVA
jgi:hypothetical protein